MLLPGSVKNVVGDAGALPRSASAPGVFVFLVVLLAGVAGSGCVRAAFALSRKRAIGNTVTPYCAGAPAKPRSASRARCR